MFVRTLEQLRQDGQESISAGGAVRVVHFLGRSDGMGFSLSDVYMDAGQSAEIWIKHQWEANYVVSGQAELQDLTTGQSWQLSDGSLYGVGPTDKHRFSAASAIHGVVVLVPPLGNDGSFHHDELPPRSEPMFVTSVSELRAAGHEKVVAGGSARTVRMLTRKDQMGITISDVTLAAGNRNVLWYKYHWEANFILTGDGEVSDLTTDERWPLTAGTMYCVGPMDRHSMHAHTELHLLSVFCPALEGSEMHDEEGTLAPSGPVPPGPGAS